jgi:hypothetical protein
LTHFPSDFWVDLRKDGFHSGWYELEIDGRWSVRAEMAEIKIPLAPHGDYQLEFEVVDSFYHLGDGVFQVHINGVDCLARYSGIVERSEFPGIITSVFSHQDDFSMEIRLGVKEECQSHVIRELPLGEERNLGIKIRSLRLLRIEK